MHLFTLSIVINTVFSALPCRSLKEIYFSLQFKLHFYKIGYLQVSLMLGKAHCVFKIKQSQLAYLKEKDLPSEFSRYFPAESQTLEQVAFLVAPAASRSHLSEQVWS